MLANPDAAASIIFIRLMVWIAASLLHTAPNDILRRVGKTVFLLRLANRLSNGRIFSGAERSHRQPDALALRFFCRCGVMEKRRTSPTAKNPSAVSLGEVECVLRLAGKQVAVWACKLHRWHFCLPLAARRLIATVGRQYETYSTMSIRNV